MRREPDRTRRCPEGGSGTVVIVAVLAVAVVLAIVVAGASSVMLARQRAQAVADLAALAGGDLAAVAAVVGERSRAGAIDARDPCGAVGEVVTANGAVVVDCTMGAGAATGDVFVVVRVPTRVGGVPVDVIARARAGPG